MAHNRRVKKPGKHNINMKTIPYGRQWIDESDIESVYCGTKYAVAVNSGTSALHIACLAADVKGGDM